MYNIVLGNLSRRLNCLELLTFKLNNSLSYPKKVFITTTYSFVWMLSYSKLELIIAIKNLPETANPRMYIPYGPEEEVNRLQWYRSSMETSNHNKKSEFFFFL